MNLRLTSCLLLSAAISHAAVNGRVVNSTTDKPQGGATITLFQTTGQGPQFIESIKSGADGTFAFTKDVQPGQGGGPVLIQAVYGGVQYNKIITPGQSTVNVEVPVFESTKQQGDAKMDQHFMVLQPAADGNMAVDEIYVFQNAGKTTWNDPTRGTLQFALPALAEGKVEVNVLAPGGMSIRRAPDPLGPPNQFKLDFPIKPGESRVEMHWTMPFKTPNVFVDRILAKGGPTRIVAPLGVSFKGDGIERLDQEPTTKATIYSTPGPDVKVTIEGVMAPVPDAQQGPDAGGGGGAGAGDSGPALSENLPKLFGLTLADSNFMNSLLAVKWIMLSILGTLAVGFALLYRKSASGNVSETAGKASSGHARGRG